MLAGGGGAVCGTLDLPFCAFLARDASNVSVACARAEVGPSAPSGSAMADRQAMKANDRTVRFTSGLSGTRLIRRAGMPCISLSP